MDTLLHKAISGDCHLLFDGGMGTMLQAAGLAAGELPELLCLTNPEHIEAIHRAYVEAGSDVITTNTFGANRLKLDGRATVDEVYAAAVSCARAAGAHLSPPISVRSARSCALWARSASMRHTTHSPSRLELLRTPAPTSSSSRR